MADAQPPRYASGIRGPALGLFSRAHVDVEDRFVQSAGFREVTRYRSALVDAAARRPGPQSPRRLRSPAPAPSPSASPLPARHAMKAYPALILLLVPMAAPAQAASAASIGNPHIQAVDYKARRPVVRWKRRPYQVTIELAPAEPVENVALGGSRRVAGNCQSPRRPAVRRAYSPDVSANLLVVTGAAPGFRAVAAFRTARGHGLDYPLPLCGAAGGIGRSHAGRKKKVVGRYKVRGSADLRPSGIHGDGGSPSISNGRRTARCRPSMP